METILEDFAYKKPMNRIERLVWEELGEAQAERPSRMVKILWREGLTFEQVKNALANLEKQGNARKYSPPKYEREPGNPLWEQIRSRND